MKSPTQSLKSFSVVLPVFNETNAVEKTISEIVQHLGPISIPWELIVVDDGSTDGTYEKLKGVDLPYLKLIRHESNRGYGAALKTGILATKYDVIVITDADGTYPTERIPELVAEMKDHKMVVGARIGKGAKISLIRRPAKFFIGLLANYMMNFKCPDLNSGLRAIEKKLLVKYLDFLPDGFSFTTTITMVLVTHSHPVKYIPIDYANRIGKSKIRPIRDTLRFIELILKTVLYFNPLKFFIPLTLGLFLLGLSFLLYDIIVYKNISDKSTLLLVTTFQVFVLALLADLIVKRS